ncbi:hypothetical protein GGI01_000151 [Coemansia sp. RSA 376]|nr:hypothetical protein GGI01_000151 [Coemansia sp. RSA 376]
MCLQDSTFELLRGLANLSSTVEDDPLYFDQLLGAAVNVKHAFDLGRMDVINGTIRPRNTSLCHECITTVSSVWRSGPDGPRTLCNACGLRYYKQNQRRAIEAKRRESRDAADAATSLATLGALDIKAARKLLAGHIGLNGASSSSNKRARNSVATSASTVGNVNIYSDDDEENDDDNDISDDEDNADYDEDRDANDKNDNDGGALNASRSNIPCDGLSTLPLATNQTSLSDYPHHHRHSTAVGGSTNVAHEHLPAVTLPSIASICDRLPTLPPLPSRLPPQQQLFLPPMMLPPFQLSSTPLHQQQHPSLPLVPSSSSLSSLTSSSSTPLTQVATGSRTIPTTGNAPVYATQYYPPPPSNGNSQHHHYYPQLQ